MHGGGPLPRGVVRYAQGYPSHAPRPDLTALPRGSRLRGRAGSAAVLAAPGDESPARLPPAVRPSLARPARPASASPAAFAVNLRLKRLLPFLEWWPRVNRSSLQRDAAAGLTNATLVLPQAVAFAAIAGLPPEYGLYTALVPPIIAALFGASWHLISGPTTAISALVFSVLADRLVPGSPAFIQAAIGLAFLAGVIQLALGLARMGQVVNFVSHAVMLGFTAGAAGLIALSQFKHALGIQLPRPEQIQAFALGLLSEVPQANPYALALAGGTLALAVLIRHWRPLWPNYMIAIAAAGGVGTLLDVGGQGVRVVGQLPSVVPPLGVPQLDLAALRELTQGALAIAIVGLLEAVAIARTLAAKAGQDLNTNQEIVGQGMSNAVGSFFGACPGSGSFTRSGVNFDAGAETPLAAVFSSLLLLLILLLVAPYFAFVPIPALAAVILLVAWRLVDFKEIARIVRTSRTDAAIAALTFFCTLLVNLEFAIYIGVFASLVLFLEKSAKPFIGVGAPDPSTPGKMFRPARKYGLKECPQLVIARIDGPMYFGSVDHLRQRLRRIERERPKQKHMMLTIKGVGELDFSGAELLIEEARRRQQHGGSLHIAARHGPMVTALRRFQVLQAIGGARLQGNKRDAIRGVVAELDLKICATCKTRIFDECPPAPPVAPSAAAAATTTAAKPVTAAVAAAATATATVSAPRTATAAPAPTASAPASKPASAPATAAAATAASTTAPPADSGPTPADPAAVAP